MLHKVNTTNNDYKKLYKILFVLQEGNSFNYTFLHNSLHLQNNLCTLCKILIKQKATQTVILIAGNHHFKIRIKVIESNEHIIIIQVAGGWDIAQGSSSSVINIVKLTIVNYTRAFLVVITS